jgi:tRNA A-37 threonylcarbamoyl transferase component Bud32
MIELINEKQREAYISELWPRLFNEAPAGLEAKFIDAGVMNFVFSVKSNSKSIYLKQALEKAKHHDKIGGDLAGIPKERIMYEENYINAIRSHLPDEIELPLVLNYDKKNNVLVLSDVMKDGILLEASLRNGIFNEKPAYNIGKFLGIAHSATMNKCTAVRGSVEEDIRNWHIFLNMRTRGICMKEDFGKNVMTELHSLYETAKSKKSCNVAINMDCCPKNIFERSDGSIGIVDFELASSVGDPAYDLGFLIGHYLIMAVIHRAMLDTSTKAIKCILNGYEKEMKNLTDDSFTERLIKYSGAILLYRVAGSSPAPYIEEKIIPLLKKAGTDLITGRFNGKFDNVYSILRSLG